MRVLVDESTGAAVVINLRAHGHDVFAVAESMPQASDSAILMQAASDRRLVITVKRPWRPLA